MNKLLSFQSQGGRRTHADFAQAASILSDSNQRIEESRVHALLSCPHTMPASTERMALARAAGLSPSQIHRIETAIDNETLPLTSDPPPSRFSAQVSNLLDRLHEAGISQQQLASRTIALGQTDPEVSQGCLSRWKHGKTRPTQATLRAFVHALERCHDHTNCPLVTADEIRKLVSTAGFTLDDLSATTHDIVSRINGSTRLKPLLAALRNAADLNVAMSAIDSDIARGNADNEVLQYKLQSWEPEGAAYSPNPSQVRDLLTRYNRLLHNKGQAELTPKEIDAVVAVAERDREEGFRHGFRKRAEEYRPPSPRRTIRPDFDGGHGR